MTGDTKSPLDDMHDMDDIELITMYLNGHLDPEGMDAVRRRIEEDAAFRDLAAPLFLAWSVPPHFERHPRPEGELERDWAEFARRTGFGQGHREESRQAHSQAQGQARRRRPRLRWLAVVVFTIAAVAAFAFAFVDPRRPRTDAGKHAIRVARRQGALPGRGARQRLPAATSRRAPREDPRR